MVEANEIKNYVEKEFSDFGINRKREVSRLLYEIAKRDQCDFRKIVKNYPSTPVKFANLKSYLLEKRYPRESQFNKRFNVLLSELDIVPAHRIKIKKQDLTLTNVYVEEDVLETNFVKRLKTKYPKATFQVIRSYSEFIKGKKYDITGYNNRLASFYIIKERYDFYKRCACSFKSVYCGYHVINLGSGCGFECSYCFLQDYINSPGIVLPANIEDFFDAFEKYKTDIRLGSGEMTDSLIFDHITEYSPQIVDFFRKYPKSSFEFKTKSDNVDLLLKAKSVGNIFVSWSVNPQPIVETIEHYTASLEARLQAAKRCVEAGYKVAFHFDPIIYYSNWKKDYYQLIEKIFDEIPEEKIGWVSVGTLRMTPRLKKIIENRFPETSILNEEFLLSYDGKLRYSDRVRAEIYKAVKTWIEAKAPNVPIYLCMEEKAMCETVEAAPLKQYAALKNNNQ